MLTFLLGGPASTDQWLTGGMRSANTGGMDSEFRLCPACRAPNTVQDAVCASCGQRLPAVSKAPRPTFDTVPGRQEVRQAAGTGVRRGLLVGITSAAVLGLLLARTFRSPSLQDDAASAAATATPAPAATVEPQPAPLAPAVPVAPAGFGQPNPYSSASAYANPGTSLGASPYSQVALLAPSPSPSPSAPARTPAMIIAAPEPGTVPSAAGRAGSKPASYTDADLARVRDEAAREETAPPSAAPETQPAAAPPAVRPAPLPERESRGSEERREAVREAQRRVEKAQAAVDDIRREARENDDDGLQEELKDALSELKDAQHDLAKAQRKLRELEDRAVRPPQ